MNNESAIAIIIYINDFKIRFIIPCSFAINSYVFIKSYNDLFIKISTNNALSICIQIRANIIIIFSYIHTKEIFIPRFSCITRFKIVKNFFYFFNFFFYLLFINNFIVIFCFITINDFYLSKKIILYSCFNLFIIIIFLMNRSITNIRSINKIRSTITRKLSIVLIKKSSF